MTTLNGYLEAFAHYLRTGDPAALAEYCQDPTQHRRLAVYRNGFYKSCIDALVANFEVCVNFLGESYFKQVARAYVDRYPPNTGTLSGYGEDLANFLRMLPQEDTDKWQGMPPAASDIARLDLAWLSSLMSANTERALTSDRVTAITSTGQDIADVSVKLNPSVRLCHLDLPVFEVWVALKSGSQIAPQPIMTSGAQSVMFWRLHGTVHARAPSFTELALMRDFNRSGANLGTTIERTLTLDPDFDVTAAFSACLHNELLEIVPATRSESQR